MPIRSVVLINESSMPLTSERLHEVAEALQTQVVRDLQPVWDETARVTAAPRSGGLNGAWPIRIVDRSPELGVHNDNTGQPYAVVRAHSNWTVTASHELLEMLVDPHGDRLIEGSDIQPEHHQRRVQYLVEVCDPCQVYDYPIGTVSVSDFVTPEYFKTNGGGKVDLLGRLSSSFEVPKGCHLSWWDAGDKRWHQKQPDGRYVRDARTANSRNRRDDRDEAFARAIGELRHDLLAAKRAMFRELAEWALEDLFTNDSRMRQIIARAREKYGWDARETEAATREYRRHLLLRYLHPGLRIAAMNKRGDLLWHEHIIDTDKYRRDCERIFGAILDHEPFYEPPAVPPEEDPHIQEARKLYGHEFDEAPPELAQTSYSP